MSENIGRRLAEISTYGRVYDRGEIVGETEKAWVVCNEGGAPHRVVKHNLIIPTTAENIVTADKRAASYAGELQRLETQMLAVRAECRVAVEAALRGE
jgi:hypothetical protein